MGAIYSTAGVLKNPLVINWKDASGPIKVDRKTVRITLRTTTQVLTGTGPSTYQISIGRQNIEGPRRSIIPQEARNANTLDASINQFPAKHRDPSPGWIKIIGRKVVTNKSADVYVCRRMNFRSDTVLSENPNFMNLGLSPVNTTDKLESVPFPTTIFGRPKNGSNWLQPGHDIKESTAYRVIETRENNHYNFKSDFENMRDIQYFERENISMSRPNLDSTPLITNTNN